MGNEGEMKYGILEAARSAILAHQTYQILNFIFV